MKYSIQLLICITWLIGLGNAQDSLYIYRNGVVITTLATAEIDSIAFSKSEIGSVTDIDNNTYKTVNIGTQTWMAENLQVTKYNDGADIPNVTDNTDWSALGAGAYCTYNNTTNTDTIKINGRLYNWFATITDKLCPTGWRVPNEAEWLQFQNTVVTAQAMASTTSWETTNVFAGSPGYNPPDNNQSGFTAYSSGYRNSTGTFNAIGTNASWWITREHPSSPTDAMTIGIDYYTSKPSTGGRGKTTGLAVRCLKNQALPHNITME